MPVERHPTPEPHGADLLAPGGPAPTPVQRQPRAPLTACLIVQDEQQRLPACLASVAFCAEIVVVDGGSSDRTVEIARAAGARVIEHPWSGFAAQRNVALDHASYDWVLEIDADERVSDRLREQIVEFLTASPEGVDIGALPLRHTFLGRALGPSGRYPLYRRRLLRRSRYRHDETRAVHEGLGAHDTAYPFTGDLEHRLADSWREAVGDRWRYARLEASNLSAPQAASSYAIGIVVRPAAKLVWRVVGFGGWRDGWQGMVNITLDVASDSMVWIRLLLRRARGGHGPAAAGGGDATTRADDDTARDPNASPTPAAGHFGRRANRGTVRVVGLADSASSAERARDWLARASAAGADVALVCTNGKPPGPPAQVRQRGVARFTPLRVVRALDAEEQLRAIDVVVTFGRRARWLARRLPRTVRGGAQPLDERATPQQAIEHAASARS